MESRCTSPVSDAVAETLFIPLYMRHLESLQKKPFLLDPEACRIVDSVEYDFSKYKHAKRTQVGTAIRVRAFDEATRAFIEREENPVIINMGCGLDTRFQRIRPEKGVFYNLDLPEVITLRDRFIEPDERNISLPYSMFDLQWIDMVRDRHPQGSFFVMAEGVFLYFATERLKPLVQAIATAFAPGELMFDACTGWGAQNSGKQETLKDTDTRFHMAMDDDHEPEEWASSLHLEEIQYMMKTGRSRWGLVANLASFIPTVGKAFRMLRYSIGKQ